MAIRLLPYRFGDAPGYRYGGDSNQRWASLYEFPSFSRLKAFPILYGFFIFFVVKKIQLCYHGSGIRLIERKPKGESNPVAACGFESFFVFVKRQWIQLLEKESGKMNANPNTPRIYTQRKSSSGNQGMLAGVIAAIVVIAVLTIVVWLVLRNGENARITATADPGSVVTKFFSSIQSKNWNALSPLIYLDSKSADPDKSQPDYIVQHDIRPLFESIKITKFTVQKWNIDGDKATVHTSITAAPENAPVSVKPMQINPTFSLKRINGEWKISAYYLPVKQ